MFFCDSTAKVYRLFQRIQGSRTLGCDAVSWAIVHDISTNKNASILMVTEPYCINPLKPNDPYSGRDAPLTSKRCIWYIYSTNIRTDYFKHGIYSPFFLSSKCSLFHNSNVFGSCIIYILYTGVLKLKKNNSGSKRLTFRLYSKQLQV